MVRIKIREGKSAFDIHNHPLLVVRLVLGFYSDSSHTNLAQVGELHPGTFFYLLLVRKLEVTMNFETLSKISVEELRDNTKRELARWDERIKRYIRHIEKSDKREKPLELNMPSITIIVI